MTKKIKKVGVKELEKSGWIITIGKKDDKETGKNSHQIKIPIQDKITIEKKRDKKQKDVGSQSKLF